VPIRPFAVTGTCLGWWVSEETYLLKVSIENRPGPDNPARAVVPPKSFRRVALLILNDFSGTFLATFQYVGTAGPPDFLRLWHFFLESAGACFTASIQIGYGHDRMVQNAAELYCGNAWT
jgi:hypothetical protein